MEEHYTVYDRHSRAIFAQVKLPYLGSARELHPNKKSDMDTAADFQKLSYDLDYLGDPQKKQPYGSKKQEQEGVAGVAAARHWAADAFFSSREDDARLRRDADDLEAHKARAVKGKLERSPKHSRQSVEQQRKKSSGEEHEARQRSASPTVSPRKRKKEEGTEPLRKKWMRKRQKLRHAKQEHRQEAGKEVIREEVKDRDVEQENSKQVVQTQKKAQRKPFRLSDLPPEIVDIIYSYALLRTPNKKRSLAMLRALSINSQLSHAAMKIYYRINTFKFQVIQGGPLDNTKTDVLEAMNRITLIISSAVIPATNLSPNITAACNVEHLTLCASTGLGLDVIISRHVADFENLKTLTVERNKEPCVANQVNSLLHPKDISKGSTRRNWMTALNVRLGEPGVKQDGEQWVWTASGDRFDMKKRSRHIRFE